MSDSSSGGGGVFPEAHTWSVVSSLHRIGENNAVLNDANNSTTIVTDLTSNVTSTNLTSNLTITNMTTTNMTIANMTIANTTTDDMTADVMTNMTANLTSTTNSTTANSTATLTESSDGEVLRNTFMVYGSALLIATLVFCLVRLLFPRPFTIRNWVDEIKTRLAENQYGFISWAWKVYQLCEDEFMEECGMDALCFARVLKFGLELSIVGMFNAIWLMPLYSTSPPSQETGHITDSIVRVTISYVPAESNRMIGTVLAAYVFFGYAIRGLLKEFDWFIEKRHKFLTKPWARNYAVYVRNIPQEFRTNAGMVDFFRQCFSDDCIYEARIRVHAPNLAKDVARRDAVVEKLEHAIAFNIVKGKKHRHRAITVTGTELVDSVETYAKELQALNKSVKEQIEAIEAKSDEYHHRCSDKPRVFGGSLEEEPLRGADTYRTQNSNGTEEPCEEESSRAAAAAAKESKNRPAVDEDGDAVSKKDPKSSPKDPIASGFGQVVSATSAAADSVGGIASKAADVTGGVVSTAVDVLKGDEDGKLYDAGFVSFTQLSKANAALQMVHHSTPFAIQVLEAPEPEDVIWENVGKPHKVVQVGRLLSNAISSSICVAWTIPTTFFASLSSVGALRAQFSVIDDLLNAAPFLEPLFELLAPLLVVLLNSMLPTILRMVTNLERPIAGAFLEASLFVKLSAFMLIQTFFVSALSGSLFHELANFIHSPLEVVDLLATSLPSQSTYFIQIVFVGTVMSSSIEILRVVPLALAAIRKYVGPNLTERERQKSFFVLRPLADPMWFQHAFVFSQCILYFMVLLVYAVIAPLTCFVVGFCFLYLGAVYRHQFVYIYPTRPDSGGQLWSKFIGILLVCMLVAQITIVGLLSLKKAASAVPLMIPLVLITALVSNYIQQQHFRVADHLPSRECIAADVNNGPAFYLSFLKGAYLQPSLRVKERFPEVDTPGGIFSGEVEKTLLADTGDSMDAAALELREETKKLNTPEERLEDGRLEDGRCTASSSNQPETKDPPAWVAR